jgi:predicted O-linked N-acetylglucosamine transferase (SPINDLY family)
MTPHEAAEIGLQHHQAGRLADAEACYAAALTIQPDFPLALHLMGLLRFQQQDYAAAIEVFGRALAAAPAGYPRLAALVASRGETHLQLGQAEAALDDFGRGLALDPRSAAVWNNRGLALGQLGRHEEALESYDRALRLAPATVQIHNNRGDALRQLRRYDEALASFSRALALDPNDWGTHNNRAIALSLMGRIDEALESYDRALSIHPDIPEALHARGNLLWSQKAKLSPAIADLERLVRITPDFPFAKGSLMRLAMTAADWRGFAARSQELGDGVVADRPVVEPFIYLAVSDDPALLKRCATLYAQHRFPPRPPLCRKGGVRRPGRIRIGYVCGEFRAHATLYLMAGLFEAHDRAAFEVFAFDNGASDGSALRARFEAAVEHIVPIAGLSDREAAALIAREEIDILVDLNGYSGNQRLNIFAHKPAPLQVSYLAYPGTLGAPYMDYILADKIVIPERDTPHFREKIAWLPFSYQINDNKRAIAQPPSRAEAGLPDDGVVFCNFNHANKFTPESFSRWMKLLEAVPGSLLWLLEPAPEAIENLRREARARGIAPERLVFAPHLPFERHLARLPLGDLFLDGLPYGAHTTASDALWAGLPVITLMGQSFAGRVAASLLTALEMPGLITDSPEEFEALAVDLARQPERLRSIREDLGRRRISAPLFDTKRAARDIEKAWRFMFDNRDKVPESFSVPP